jgi:cobalt-precorrin-5B (C1)-methyltransferase
MKPENNPDIPEKKLKTGYTTGTCATAAAKSALLALIQQARIDEITVHLPVGKLATLKIDQLSISKESCTSTVIKDAGDDPDVTNGAKICATVTWNDSGQIKLLGGIGVGKVTRPGLPVAVGEPAINPTPRKMILHAANSVLQDHHIQTGIDITIFVPDGEKIAKKTMNAQLGIIGGISILGTRGIVIPFSTAAYRATLAVTIKASAENGLKHLVLTTGGRSEKYAKGVYPDLDPMAFHEAGEFIGFALKKCLTYGVKKATICGMMGKFSKLAKGELMLHSSKSSVDFHFLAGLAAEAGANSDLQDQIKNANTANHVGEIIMENQLDQFFEVLNNYVLKVCKQKTAGQLDIEILLYTLDGKLLNRLTG